MTRFKSRLETLALRVAPLADSLAAEQSSIASNMAAAAIGVMLRLWQRYSPKDGAPQDASAYRHPRLLSTAATLVGFCILIIVSLRVTRLDVRTYSDEVAWLSATFLLASIFLSYLSTRSDSERRWQRQTAHLSFLLGIQALVVSMVIAAVQFVK